jgi:hypothetical protein
MLSVADIEAAYLYPRPQAVEDGDFTSQECVVTGGRLSAVTGIEDLQTVHFTLSL